MCTWLELSLDGMAHDGLAYNNDMVIKVVLDGPTVVRELGSPVRLPWMWHRSPQGRVPRGNQKKQKRKVHI